MVRNTPEYHLLLKRHQVQQKNLQYSENNNISRSVSSWSIPVSFDNQSGAAMHHWGTLLAFSNCDIDVWLFSVERFVISVQPCIS